MKTYKIYAGDPGEEKEIRLISAENKDEAEEKMCYLMSTHRWFRSWLLKESNGKTIAGRMWF